MNDTSESFTRAATFKSRDRADTLPNMMNSRDESLSDKEEAEGSRVGGDASVLNLPCRGIIKAHK